MTPATPIAALPPSRWGWLWRELRLGVPLCAGVALFLSIAFRGPIVDNLVYSFSIGLTIQFSIEAGRYGLAAWLQHRQPGRTDLSASWPGWGPMIPWIGVSVVLGYGLGTLLGDALIGGRHARSLTGADPRALASMLAVSIVVSVAATYFFYSRSRLATSEARVEAARRTAAESQLKLLQSQLEPHMLFNTLANLRVLIGIDPHRAQAMLDRLIAFLRATLEASRRDTHPLATEFDRIADYLELMGVRMGPRLSVVLDLPDDLRALSVPPLLLQPLVENAIRHGLEPKVEGGRIEVRARRDGAGLHLSVRDTGVGIPTPGTPLTPTARALTGTDTGTGFGTTQVRERLAALHGPRAALHLGAAADADGGTQADITLPLP